MKNVLGGIIAFAIMVAIGYWILCAITPQRQTETVEKKAEDEEHLQIDNSVMSMVMKHNAVRDWRRQFHKEDTSLRPALYTVEVEDALIGAGSRPVLLFAMVEDVVRDANSYSVSFHNWWDSFFALDIHYVLDCTQDQVDKIMRNPRNITSFPNRNNYAVIARISDIQKCRLTLQGEEDGEINLHPTIVPRNVFIATGRCLDLLFVDDYRLKNSQEARSK